MYYTPLYSKRNLMARGFCCENESLLQDLKLVALRSFEIHHTSAPAQALLGTVGKSSPRGSRWTMECGQGLRFGSYGFQRGYSLKLSLLCPDKATVPRVSSPSGPSTWVFCILAFTDSLVMVPGPHESLGHLRCHLQPGAPPEVAVPVCLGHFSWVG